KPLLPNRSRTRYFQRLTINLGGTTPMRWLQTEYLLKGLYLGVLAHLGLRAATAPTPNWQTPLLVTAFTFSGLAIALGIAAHAKSREGYRIKGRALAFVLFLLLECPALVYAGILIGTAVGAVLLSLVGSDLGRFVEFLGGGVLLGVAFGALQTFRNPWARLGMGLALGAAAVGAAVYGISLLGDEGFSDVGLTVLGLQSLLGVPVFYLLVFSGREEESEVEIAFTFALLGLGSSLLLRHTQLRSLCLVLSMMFYVAYLLRVMPYVRRSKP